MKPIVAGLAVVALIAVSALLRTGGVPGDVATVVHAADPLRVRLPVGASPATISRMIHAELTREVDRATNPTVKAALGALVADSERLGSIAGSGHERFAAGRTAALAYPLYSVSVGEESVVVVSMTIELIPGYHGMAESRDHEDGHAYINAELARRCAAPAVSRIAIRGASGVALERAVIAELTRLGDLAHDVYHTYVEDALLGEHMRYAVVAVHEVTEGCK